MVQRDVFECMREFYPERRHMEGLPDGNFDDRKETFAWFDPRVTSGETPKERIYLSEDYSFSLDYRNMGGKIILDPSIKLRHYGVYGFGETGMTWKQYPSSEARGDENGNVEEIIGGVWTRTRSSGAEHVHTATSDVTQASEEVSFQWMLGDAGSTATIPSDGSIVSNFYDFSVLNWAMSSIGYVSTLSAGTITVEASRNGIDEFIEVSSSEVFTAWRKPYHPPVRFDGLSSVSENYPDRHLNYGWNG